MFSLEKENKENMDIHKHFEHFIYIFFTYIFIFYFIIFFLHNEYMLLVNLHTQEQIQPNFNGSNTFGTMRIHVCSRQGQFRVMSVNHNGS